MLMTIPELLLCVEQPSKITVLFCKSKASRYLPWTLRSQVINNYRRRAKKESNTWLIS